MPGIVSKLLLTAVFQSLSRLTVLRQVVDLDLLICTGFDFKNADLFQCLTFILRQKSG